jgi:hypothetical protein
MMLSQMKLAKILVPGMLLCTPLCASAQSSNNGVTLHGSVKTDILFPEEDTRIGTGTYKDDVLSNTYADLRLLSRYVDAGVRVEYMEQPLPGFENDFKGWGVPNIYVKGKYKGLELTAGDFYEQFGNGFILRTYEERTLGIDNSIRGARLKVNALRGLRFTALGGVQRRYWDWSTASRIYGADAEFNIDEYSPSLRAHNATWMVGASYVLKKEDDENILVPGSNLRLNLPNAVSAFDVRTHFTKNNFGILGEFAWKSQDPSFDNSYIYNTGNAVMLSGTYSKSGLSALLQVKRSENMAYRSQRSMDGTSAWLNNMPAFSYQHTYALAALYPYATQAADGEWAFQGQFSYNFKRNTALGGKYGTKIHVNASYIKGLTIGDVVYTLEPTLTMGSNGAKYQFFGMGEEYYHDFNVQIDKKVTRDFSFVFMYMNQRYNKTVVEGHGGNIDSNIFVYDGKYRLTKRLTLRTELQYLTTKDDDKDWCYGLAELSVAPYLMFSLSDMWNNGSTKTHYYMAAITGNYKANRLMLSYGRTRAGYNCSGGVCRWVPATRGFQISYSYNF